MSEISAEDWTRMMESRRAAVLARMTPEQRARLAAIEREIHEDARREAEQMRQGAVDAPREP